MYRLGLVALLACRDDKPQDDGASADADADTDSDSDADADGDADADVGTASLGGRVLDEDGAPVPGARVNLCRGICLTQTTTDQGEYGYSELLAQTNSFYVFPPQGADLMAPIVPLTIDEQDSLSVDIVLHPPTATAPMPAQAVEVELSGLLLTVGLDTLDEPVVGEIGDRLAVALVDPAETLPIELSGTLIAVWHLAPFEIESEVGLPLRVQNLWALPAGESYRVWVASSPADYTWFDQGQLTVSADGATLEGDVRLPILSTVVLVDD